MDDYYFIDEYKNNIIRGVLLLIMGIIFSIILFANGASSYYQHLMNPHIIDNNDEYASLTSQYEYLKIPIGNIHDLDLSDISSSQKLGTVLMKAENNRYYAAIAFNKKILIAQISENEAELIENADLSYILEGYSKKLSESSLKNIKDKLSAMGYDENQLNNIVYTNCIYTSSPLRSVSQLLICAALTLLISLMLFIPMISRNTKCLRALNKFSLLHSDVLYEKINEELLKDTVSTYGPVSITDNFIVIISYGFVGAMPISELRKAYEDTGLFYKFTSMFRQRKLSFILSDGTKFTVNMEDDIKDINNILDYIYSRYPEIKVRYMYN